MKTPTQCAPCGGLAVRFGGRYPSWSGIIPTVKDWAAMPFSRGVQTASRSLIIIAVLSGCASTPVTVVEKIQVPTFVPVPSTLTVPISVDLTGATWGSAVGSLNAALQTCDARLDAIGKLKPPPSSYRR